MSNTLWEIINEVLFLLWETSTTSSTYSVSQRIVPKINSVITQICSGEYKNILKDTIYKSWDLRFLRNKIFINNVAWLPTTNEVNSWDVFVAMSTVNFQASWYAMIWGNIFSYTWITPTALTWVSWIIWDFPAWTLVEQVYLVPSEADRSFALRIIKKNNTTFNVENQDNKFDPSAFAYFEILPDTQSSDNNFLYIPTRSWNTYWSVNNTFWFEYYRTPNELVWDTDVTILPEDIGTRVVAPLVAWELLYESEEIADAVNKLNLWYSKLHLFYTKQKSFNKQFRNKVNRNRPNNYYLTTVRKW